MQMKQKNQSLTVLTLNLNGLRAAYKKGLFPWLLTVSPDVICFQEIKIAQEQLQSHFELPGYFAHFLPAEKKGYSGVAIYAKKAPKRVQEGFSCAFSKSEGRYLQFDFEEYSIASVYFPSGTSGPERQAMKLTFLADFKQHLHTLREKNRPIIFAGDFNIAHKTIDIKNWKANQIHSGFLPEERVWMDSILELGFIDAFRACNLESEQYTWWSQRGKAREKNVGWRIDYQIVSPEWGPRILSSRIETAYHFSDHAPLLIEYGIAN